LFVSPRKILVKTCGSTTLLLALGRILEIAKGCGFDSIESLYYSRKNFLEPERQVYPHRNFSEEVSSPFQRLSCFGPHFPYLFPFSD